MSAKEGKVNQSARPEVLLLERGGTKTRAMMFGIPFLVSVVSLFGAISAPEDETTGFVAAAVCSTVAVLMLANSCTLKLGTDYINARLHLGGLIPLGHKIPLSHIRSIEVRKGRWSIAGGIGYRRQRGLTGITLGGTSHLTLRYLSEDRSRERTLIFASSRPIDEVRETSKLVAAARDAEQ